MQQGPPQLRGRVADQCAVSAVPAAAKLCLLDVEVDVVAGWPRPARARRLRYQALEGFRLPRVCPLQRPPAEWERLPPGTCFSDHVLLKDSVSANPACRNMLCRIVLHLASHRSASHCMCMHNLLHVSTDIMTSPNGILESDFKDFLQ